MEQNLCSPGRGDVGPLFTIKLGRKIRSDSLCSTPQSFVQARAHGVRQREELAVAIKLYGFAGGVKHRVAVVALSKVSLKSLF